MKIKKYYAPNPLVAFKQIKAELGSEAAILHTQKVRRAGWLGFLQGPTYELTVAVDEPEDGVVQGNGRPAQEAQVGAQPALPFAVRPTDPLVLANELGDIRASIKDMQATIDQLTNIGGSRPVARKSPQLTRLRDVLAAEHLDQEIIAGIAKHVQFELSTKAMQDWPLVTEATIRHLERRFATIDVTNGTAERAKVIFVVGPTGAGKTTTIAKLAAICSADKTRHVSLATTDTVRIGAVAQLQAYADIFGVPLEIAHVPADLAQSVGKLGAADLLLVDTAGCGPKNASNAQLGEFISTIDISLVLLTVSATTRDEDATSAIQRLAGVPLNGLIVTKLDETCHGGAPFNLMYRSGLPVAYVTNGQIVPDDIEPASIRKMAERLLGQSSECNNKS